MQKIKTMTALAPLTDTNTILGKNKLYKITNNKMVSQPALLTDGTEHTICLVLHNGPSVYENLITITTKCRNKKQIMQVLSL